MKSTWLLAAIAFAFLAPAAGAQEKQFPKAQVLEPPVVTDDDYPVYGMRNLLSGKTSMQIWVNKTGGMNSCIVTRTSGSDLLDQAACAVWRRARFAAPDPALGTAAVLNTALTWRLPGEYAVPFDMLHPLEHFVDLYPGWGLGKRIDLTQALADGALANCDGADKKNLQRGIAGCILGRMPPGGWLGGLISRPGIALFFNGMLASVSVRIDKEKYSEGLDALDARLGRRCLAMVAPDEGVIYGWVDGQGYAMLSDSELTLFTPKLMERRLESLRQQCPMPNPEN